MTINQRLIAALLLIVTLLVPGCRGLGLDVTKGEVVSEEDRAAEASAAEARAEVRREDDRSRLWNDCKPMYLEVFVTELGDDATAMDLTKEAVEIAVRSRLRAARLYIDLPPDSASLWELVDVIYGAFLSPVVTISDGVFVVQIKYKKIVKDLATKQNFTTTTWNTGTFGTHGQDSGFILSAVAQYTEPPRYCRRLKPLRGLAYENTTCLCPGSTGTSGSIGIHQRT